jgi:hypothetical protein
MKKAASSEKMAMREEMAYRGTLPLASSFGSKQGERTSP